MLPALAVRLQQSSIMSVDLSDLTIQPSFNTVYTTADMLSSGPFPSGETPLPATQADLDEVTCSPKELPLSERPDRLQKRKRVSKKDVTTAKLGDGAVLSEHDLIKLNSEEIDDYIHQLHRLSKSEERDLKRIRRSIKNREYAQESRDRQKQLLESCRERCDTLEAEKSAMETRALQAEHINTELVAQVQLLVAGLRNAYDAITQD